MKDLNGQLNIPYKNLAFTGVETATAITQVDNGERKISVDVKIDNLATKEYVDNKVNTEASLRELSDTELSNKIDSNVEELSSKILENKEDIILTRNDLANEIIVRETTDAEIIENLDKKQDALTVDTSEDYTGITINNGAIGVDHAIIATNDYLDASIGDTMNYVMQEDDKICVNFASKYDSSKTYNTGDYVINSHILWKAKEDGITGSWNILKWETVQICDVVDSFADKDYVDNQITTRCLTKVVPQTASKWVYGVDNSGSTPQFKTYEIREDVKTDSIVLRGTSGRVKVGNPSDDKDAVNLETLSAYLSIMATKTYVDNAVATLTKTITLTQAEFDALTEYDDNTNYQII